MLIRERGSGLLVAEQAAAPRPIRDALKRVDPDLTLGSAVDARHDAFVWQVFVRRGDKPALWLFDWREDMQDLSSPPRPLSWGIVEEAAGFRLDSRRPRVDDPLAENDRLVAKQDAEAAQLVRDLAEEAERASGRLSPIKRSVGLRISRDRIRARGGRV